MKVCWLICVSYSNDGTEQRLSVYPYMEYETRADLFLNEYDKYVFGLIVWG